MGFTLHADNTQVPYSAVSLMQEQLRCLEQLPCILLQIFNHEYLWGIWHKRPRAQSVWPGHWCAGHICRSAALCDVLYKQHHNESSQHAVLEASQDLVCCIWCICILIRLMHSLNRQSTLAGQYALFRSKVRHMTTRCNMMHARFQ